MASMPLALLPPGLSSHHRLSNPPMVDSLSRLLLYDLDSGDLAAGPVRTPPGSGAMIIGRPITRAGVPAIRPLPLQHARGSDLSAYLEEFCRRLEQPGYYLASEIVPLEPQSVGLCLFPQV